LSFSPVASKSKRIKFLKEISGTLLCGNVSEASIRRPVQHNFACVGLLLQTTTSGVIPDIASVEL